MLDTLKLAIVDVETTGCSAASGRIIEVGVVRVEAGEPVESFETLINPECPIPPIIEQLTGISDRDVEGAPTFGSVAVRLRELLEDAVFVAHNAPFDASFVRSEFERLGQQWESPRLCTVRLSRRLYPGFRRHNLSSLIERFGLDCERRHRALDDARAVWAFIARARAEIPQEKFDQALRQLLGMRPLPEISKQGGAHGAVA